MKNIFKFVIDEKIVRYKEHSINISVELKKTSVEFNFKKLNLIKKKINGLFSVCKKDLIKIRVFYKRKDEKMLRFAVNSLNVQLELIFSILNENFPDEICNSITQFKKLLNNYDVDNIISDFEKFWHSLALLLDEQISMFEQLSNLNTKKLRAIVYFRKDGTFDTHFTKYNLNLERFSDYLHSLLKREFDFLYVSKYKELEKKHFDLINNKIDNNIVTVEEFYLFTDRIMENYSKIQEINPIFLNAQVNKLELTSDIDSIINLNKKIYDKINMIYDLITVKKKTNFYRIIKILFRNKLRDLIFLKKEQLITLLITKISAAEQKPLKFIPFFILEKLEPKTTIELKKYFIKKIQEIKGYDFVDTNEQYFIKKTKENLFTNNLFYNKQLILYSFIPETTTFQQNKYLKNNYDKIELGEQIIRFKDKVFSEIFKEKISYEIYFKIRIYQIDITTVF